MSGSGSEAVPQGPADDVPADRRRLVALAVGVVLVVLVVLVWVLVQRGDGTSPAAAPGTTPSATPSASAVPSEATTTGPSAAAAEPTVDGTEPPPGGEVAPPDTYEPTTEPAVGLEAAATFATGVGARLTRIESVAGQARGPGEVAGPAVRVTVELTNTTTETVGLDAAVVDVYAGEDLVPGAPLSGPGVRPLSGTLAPGASTTARYVFAVDPALRDRLQVTVSYDPTVTTVLFEGTAPAA